MLLTVDNITCQYGDQPVVAGMGFQVQRGEIVSLLGPSGCGKTTALRAIAGFEPLSAGHIELDGHVVSEPGHSLAPEARHIGMVFQDYALFPHLTVAENIAFGLRGVSPADRRETLHHMLDATGLHGLGARYPHELSGGQAQRVALARALAPKPLLLLMDEPFSNLDVELRERLSLEVRDILKAEGITGILVTHDQHEAFAVSDKIGVMQGGKILQWDTPYNLYHEPSHRFVADFVGQGEFLLGEVIGADSFQTELGVLKTDKACVDAIGRKVDVLFRPDDIIPDESGDILAKVVEKAFKGAEILYTLQLSSGSKLLSLFPSHRNHALGEQVRVRIDAQHLICFPHQD